MSVDEAKAKSDADTKTEWKYKLAVLVFCIAVNYVGSVIAFDNSYRFLFLDMIGTFVAAVVFGPVFAVATALLTNTLTSITTPNLAHFAFANAAGGLWWAFAAKRGWLAVLRPQSSTPRTAWQRIRPSVQLIAAGGVGACIVVSVVAVLLKTFVFGHETATYGDYLFTAMPGPDWFRALAADIVLSFPDKTLVAMAGCIIVQSYLRFTKCQICDIPPADRRRLAAANSKDLWILGPTLAIFLTVLFWHHAQLFHGGNHVAAHGTVALLTTALLATICVLVFASTNRTRNALADLFAVQSRRASSAPDDWFLWTLTAGLALIAVLYWYLFAELGKTPWAYYASKSWPIAPSWTAIIAIVGLAVAQIFIARVNEDRAATIALRAEADARDETRGVVNVLGRELHRALSGPRQTAQELETGWETNQEIVSYVRNAVIDARHEPGNWLGQTPLDGRPFNEEELAVCRGVIEFVKDRLRQHYANIPEMFDFTLKTLTVAETAALVEEIVEQDHRAVAARRYIDLGVAIDERVRGMSDVVVHLVPSQLRAILRNLVSNSVQAIERLYRRSGDDQFRRRIIVAVAFDHDLAVSVTDEGGGFAPEIIGDVYVARVASSKKRIGGGARCGEGTMLVKAFVAQMGAGISAANVMSDSGNLGARTAIHMTVSSIARPTH